ncbi:carbon-nitrogen hydrolase family protein [Paraburkholderia sediminicola]|uniref:carbon-nitrogen hydrolase family protein n=1 Tax=Paraburkholderia sediminicola TaxID=458836 RepID=UPI0038BA192A
MKFFAVQMNSQDDKIFNCREAERLIRAAAADGAELVVLPEYFACLSGDDDVQRASGDTFPDGDVFQWLSRLARELRIFLHAGSVVERDGLDRFNTSVVFNKEGEILARYRKIHLFDVEVPGGMTYLESARVGRGNDIVTYRVGLFTVGCAICYDIRFPELFRKLVDKGCDIIILPAAFTSQTGKDHWEVLLRARAIECQSYVIACNQVATHANGSKSSWGHSMIVDPWGTVVAQASDTVCTVSCNVDKSYVDVVRQNMPVANHHVIKGSGDVCY